MPHALLSRHKCSYLLNCVRKRKAYVRATVLCVSMVLAAYGAQSQSASAAKFSATSLSPFQQRALLALSPAGTPFSALTLTGTVQRTAGSTHESGTLILRTSVDGSLTETWSGAGNNRVITCTDWASGRTCTISVGSKTQELQGVANQRTVPWFAPWAGVALLSGLKTSATESADTAGDTVLAFSPAYGFVAGLPAPEQKQLQQMAQAATVNVLFDKTTALPSGLRYSEPLSSEPTNAIDISVVYSDYSLEQGFMLPHHIQRYLQRTLESDIHITSVSLN